MTSATRWAQIMLCRSVLAIVVLVPIIQADEDPACYTGFPVLRDCVTARIEGEDGHWVFCHEHYQILGNMKCDYSNPAPQCFALPGCVPWGPGKSRMTWNSEMAYERCVAVEEDDEDDTPSCWHCPAYIVCRIDLEWNNEWCAGQWQGWYWFGE